MYSPDCEDMGVVLKLEERTLVVVLLADIAGVALAGHGGRNTVKETQTQLCTPPLEDTKHYIMRCIYRCRCRDGY